MSPDSGTTPNRGPHAANQTMQRRAPLSGVEPQNSSSKIAARLGYMSNVLGIDIGGSGIKGAPVDLETGQFAAERLRIATPQPATPEACAQVVGQIVKHFDAQLSSDSAIGVALPAPIRHGEIPFMANLDQSWVGVNVNELFSQQLAHATSFVNDADAAGLAEVRYGAAKDVKGVVIVTTLGTGIGTAIINDGELLPNTELGHLEIDGYDAESRASSAVKAEKKLTFKAWSKRLQRYYSTLEKLFWPDLFIVGGGVSKQHEKFLPLLDLKTPIKPAALLNQAGITGAAVVAAEAAEQRSGHDDGHHDVPTGLMDVPAKKKSTE